MGHHLSTTAISEYFRQVQLRVKTCAGARRFSNDFGAPAGLGSEKFVNWHHLRLGLLLCSLSQRSELSYRSPQRSRKVGYCSIILGKNLPRRCSMIIIFILPSEPLEVGYDSGTQWKHAHAE
jgi:hypothetical protein